MLAQALGLAERLGLVPEVKRLLPRPPWTWLPPGLWPLPLAALAPGSDVPAPPWPDLAISCGRRAVPYALLVKRRSGDATVTVHIQNPRVDPARFDLLAVPRHDGLEAANVVQTEGSLHRVTRARLDAEAERFRGAVAGLPRPLVTVLVGGSSGAYRIDRPAVAGLADRLRDLAARTGCGLLVTPSRRTGEANVAELVRRLADVPARVWDLTGDNPYFGFLGLADHVLVTEDSVNMTTEATATGRPVHVLSLPGGSRRMRDFHARLNRLGCTRPFEGNLPVWTYPPLDDTGNVAAAVATLLARRPAA